MTVAGLCVLSGIWRYTHEGEKSCREPVLCRANLRLPDPQQLLSVSLALQPSASLRRTAWPLGSGSNLRRNVPTIRRAIVLTASTMCVRLHTSPPDKPPDAMAGVGPSRRPGFTSTEHPNHQRRCISCSHATSRFGRERSSRA